MSESPSSAWSRKVAAALVPAVKVTPTPRTIAKMVGCWILKKPYLVPGCVIEARVLIRPDVDVKFEIGSLTAEIHR